MRKTRSFTLWPGCLFVLAACGSGDGSPPGASSACTAGVEYCGAIPLSANACADIQYWPLVMHSGLRPLTLHYSRLADEPKAAEIIGILEHAWTVQVDELGFTAPLDDNGTCGDDGRYDVFIWRGVDGAFVDAIGDNPQTPHDDYTTYMAIDTSGRYGRELLDTTLAHEFNHALQASDDWWESALFFEMSATFAEALVYPLQEDYFFTIGDFQRHPEWSLFFDDNYDSWYMYGAAMYLHFLREQYFPADPGFIARIWRMTRNDPASGEPDFIDAIRAVLLADRGLELDQTVTEFMQWRWFVAGFDDGAHFLNGGNWPASVSYLEIDAAVPNTAIDLSIMTYGAGYLRINNGSPAGRQFTVGLQTNDTDVVWRLTTARGNDVTNTLSVAPQSAVTLVTTVLPANPISAASLSFNTRTATLSLDLL